MGVSTKDDDPRNSNMDIGAQLYDKFLRFMTSKKGREWIKKAPGYILDIRLIDRIDDYDFKSSPFFHKLDPGYKYRDLFNFNEILSCLINVPLNIAVILTFCRVAGLDRLPSRLFVSMAASQLLASLHIILHMLTVNSEFFGTNAVICRTFSLFMNMAWTLLANVITSALIERLLTHCASDFYSRAGHIFGPALVCAPWVFFVYALLLVHYRYSGMDYGYECNSHFNLRPPDMELQELLIGANTLCWVVFWALVVAVALSWNVDSGDPIENNRVKFQRKTTFLIVKVCLAQYISNLPLVIALMLIDFSRPVEADEMVHGAWQTTLYAGPCLFLVLFTRKEFRRQLRYAFSSRELIARQKKTNILVRKNAGNFKPIVSLPVHKGSIEESTESGRSKLGSLAASEESYFQFSNINHDKSTFLIENANKVVPTLTSRELDYEMPDFLN